MRSDNGKESGKSGASVRGRLLGGRFPITLAAL